MQTRITVNSDERNNVWYLEVANILFYTNFDTENDTHRAIRMLKDVLAGICGETNIEVFKNGEPE